MSKIDRAIEYNSRRYQSDESVRHIQRVVGAKETGEWDDLTIRAICEWQAAHSLTTDGMVGPRTWALMPAPEASTDSTRAIVMGLDVDPPEGLTWRNWRAQDVRSFKQRRRPASHVNEIVVHESVTRSWQTTQRVLLRNGYGVHVMVSPDGSVTQHNDLVSSRVVHCRSHNGPSVGIEIVSPYYRKHAGDPWGEVIKAPWAHRNEYALATLEQCRTLARLIAWMTRSDLMRVPRRWHGLTEGKWCLKAVPGVDDDGNGVADRSPGIWSHAQVGDHSDGSWPLLVAFLVVDRGLSVESAYGLARKMATGARRTVTLDE